MPRIFRLTLALLALCGAAGAQAQVQPPSAASAAQAALERAQQAKTPADVLAALGVSPAAEVGKRVLLEVPDVVAAGRSFKVRVSSQMPGTDWILILSERDSAPMVKLEEFTPGADRAAEAEIKLSQTGRVRAFVRSSGRYYQVSREVKVALPEGSAR